MIPANLHDTSIDSLKIGHRNNRNSDLFIDCIKQAVRLSLCISENREKYKKRYGKKMLQNSFVEFTPFQKVWTTFEKWDINLNT